MCAPEPPRLTEHGELPLGEELVDGDVGQFGLSQRLLNVVPVGRRALGRRSAGRLLPEAAMTAT